ncbi:MAG: hypothetical protein HYV07_03590 [Deltaproteobacteria bacterium]|nr:hypothetical protein [Deltaproteobacteria bacterium]
MRCEPLLLALLTASTASAEEVSFRPTLELYGALQGAGYAESAANPDNSILRIPTFRALTEVRPDLKVEVGDALTLRARARFMSLIDAAMVSESLERSDPRFESSWLDLYGEWRVSDSVIVAYGLHSFEWGPAESTSPSNGLVRNPGFASTFLTAYPGRHLARVNLSAGRSLSAVLMLETMPSDATSPLEPFDPKGQAKLEYAAEDGGWYVGLVAGSGTTWRPWIGEYVSLELFEGLSAYFDGRQAQGSRAFYPAPFVPSFEQSRIEDDTVSTFFVGGLRYAFEAGADLRVELVHDDDAYDADETARSVGILAVGGETSPLLAGPYVSPGFDLPGKNTLFVSVRVPDLGPSSSLMVYARELVSLTDGSGVFLAVVDWAATDALVVDFTAGIMHGEKDRELTRLTRGLGIVAAKYSW